MSRFAAKTDGYESEADMPPSPAMSMDSPEGGSSHLAVDEHNSSVAFFGNATNSVSNLDTSSSSYLEGASGLSSRASSLSKRNSAAFAGAMESQEQVKSPKLSPGLVFATRTRASPRLNTPRLSTPGSLTKLKTPSKIKLSSEKPVLKEEIKKEETKVKVEPVVDTVSVPTAPLFFECASCIYQQRLKGMRSKRKMPEDGFPNPKADPSRCIECGKCLFSPRQDAFAFYMNPHKETRVFEHYCYAK